MKNKTSLVIIFVTSVLLVILGGYLFAGKQIDTQSAGFQITLEAISVLLFGGVMSLILESQNRKYERSQQIQTSNIARLRYLHGIKIEIDAILKPFGVFAILADKTRVEEIIDRGEPIPEFSDSIRSIQDLSRTTYWDALIPSGLLPSVVSPELLSRISDFYHSLRVLIRILEDYKKDIEQDDLVSASRGISSRVSNHFRKLQKKDFIRETLLPILTEISTTGKDILRDLNEEINHLEQIEGIVRNPNEKIADTLTKVNSKSEIEFEDIQLLDLNEFLTREKESNNDEAETEYEFVLRLSGTPPTEWGEKIEYGSAKTKRHLYMYEDKEIEYFDTATVKGRYLILEGTQNQLESNLASLIESIRRHNKEYRNMMKQNRDSDYAQALELEEKKRAIKEIKDKIDNEIMNLGKGFSEEILEN